MKDKDETKVQRIKELVGLHKRVAELDASETELKHAEKPLRESEYKSILRELPDIVYKIDPDGYFTFINNSVRILGYGPEELIGKHFSKIIHPDDVKSFSRSVVLPKYKGKVTGDEKAPKLFDERRTGKRKTKDLEVRLIPKRWKRTKKHLRKIVGTVIAFSDVSSTGHYATDVKKKGKKILGTLGIIREITERKRAEETIRHLAYHDPLTNLPNRLLFNDRFTIAVAQAQRNRKKLAVMMLDLDHFKDINDTLGHKVGDKLLQCVGGRLTNLLRKSDTIARIGGDEFLVLLPQILRLENATKVSQKIIQVLQKPFAFDGHMLDITTSIGIAIYPIDGKDADILVRNADIAMYRVKEQGRNNYQLYSYVKNIRA